MNPTWITAAVSVMGFIGNLLWTVINLRIENKILTRLDELKDWADARFVMKADPPPAPARRRVAA